MNPMGNLMAGGGGGTNLFDILVNIAFGFVAGLMLLFGPKVVIDFGTKLATSIMGSQMGASGFAMYAPYIVIAPIGGLVVKQLTAVRSLKSLAFFAAAVIVGFVIAFLTQSYFKTLIS